MGVFHDTIGSWADDEGNVNVPDDWNDSLSAAYDADMSEATTGANAQIEVLTAANAALQAELTETQAANWRLVQAIPAGDTDSSSAPENSENDEAGDDPSTITTDDLFS